MIAPEVIDDIIGKAQLTRVFDVGILGPAMIYAATRGGKLPQWLRVFLFLGGLGTITYNLRNYLIQKNIREGKYRQ